MDHTFERAAEYYLSLARQSAKASNSLAARMAYFMSILAWKKAVELHPSLSVHLIEAQEEYVQFVRSDSRYKEILVEIRGIIASKPGIHEVELFAELSNHHETELRYALYFAIKDGQVWSVKKGEGCELYLPSSDDKFAFPLLEVLHARICMN